MSDFKSVSTMDLSALFAVRAIKPLTLQWYADLREAQREMLTPPPSRFADRRLFLSPFVFPFAPAAEQPLPEVKVEAMDYVAKARMIELTRFAMPQPIVIDPVAAKAFLTVAAPANVNIPTVPALSVAEKPRKTLSLKAPVELPAMTSISKGSTSADLAGAFKSEMKTATEVRFDAYPPAARDVVVEKRRAPSQHKSWKELMADAEKPTAKPRDFDLAGAFKREMQILMAEQAQTAPATSAKPQAPVVKKRRTLAA